MAAVWRDHTFDYGLEDESVELKVNIPMHYCLSCDLSLIDDVGAQLKHEAICHHVGLLSPREIRGIRDRQHMTREEFAKITGLGDASLGRWERGAGFQSQANDRYLRLLAQPKGISRLRAVVDSIHQMTERLPNKDKKATKPRFRVLYASESMLQNQTYFELTPRRAA